MRKFGLRMELPEGKLAGYYAQIVKALAETVSLYDRDKELIVVSSAEEQSDVARTLAKFKITWEPIPLWLLPEDARIGPQASDYGFTSKFGNHYLYADITEIFRLSETQKADAETAPAILQFDEHIIASYELPEAVYYAVESHLKETIEGIAERYGVSVSFLE